MENFGYPKPDLVALVILAWVIVYFCIWKGVKSTGKVTIENKISKVTKCFSMKPLFFKGCLCYGLVSLRSYGNHFNKRHHSRWCLDRFEILLDSKMGSFAQSDGKLIFCVKISMVCRFKFRSN